MLRILVIDAGLFAGSKEHGAIAATGPWAFGASISYLHSNNAFTSGGIDYPNPIR
jgi:hypothetical protein